LSRVEIKYEIFLQEKAAYKPPKHWLQDEQDEHGQARESGRGNKRARVRRGSRNPKHGKRKALHCAQRRKGEKNLARSIHKNNIKSTMYKKGKQRYFFGEEGGPHL
jgi:hypothetical protein